jgi:hypothetical protein
LLEVVESDARDREGLHGDADDLLEAALRRRGLVSSLYRTARMANDISVLTSGNPRRITRRAKNKILGRALGRAGLWRLLWK